MKVKTQSKASPGFLNRSKREGNHHERRRASLHSAVQQAGNKATLPSPEQPIKQPIHFANREHCVTCGKKKPEIQNADGGPSTIHLFSVPRRRYRSSTQEPSGFSEGYAAASHAGGTCGT